MKYCLSLLIKIYQITISPDHSVLGKYFYPTGACRFYPPCSENTRASILQHGALKGIWKGTKQIGKCI